AGLTPAWRVAFGDAWDSFRAGRPPVGAVVVDAEGSIVSRGRSRRGERAAGPNQLAGSRLAHAEINALAQLRVDQSEDHHLLVTLEPCFLCAAAIVTCHVRRVSFAGSDPMWRFVGVVRDVDTVLASRWYVAAGPFPGPA